MTSFNCIKKDSCLTSGNASHMPERLESTSIQSTTCNHVQTNNSTNSLLSERNDFFPIKFKDNLWTSKSADWWISLKGLRNDDLPDFW